MMRCSVAMVKRSGLLFFCYLNCYNCSVFRSMLRLLCIATAALMLSLLFNVLVMWKYVGSNRDEQHTSYLARSYPYFSATARDSDSTSDSFSDEEEESEEESTKIKAFLLNCLQFRAHQYSKLHSNDEVYEMNNLEN